MRVKGAGSRGTPYPTVDELTREARAMVAARPDTVRLRTVGTSRAGRPLRLLSAGHGRRQILTVAGAHANEPVGGASSLALAADFVRDPRVLDELDCTWHFLLCLDPDGTTLGQRRLTEHPAGTPTLDGYYRGFYRPAFVSQPEFPPVSTDPHLPMPESRALIGLIDELRPVLQFSLHGVEVGGSFLQLTRPVAGAARAFRSVAAELGIPLEYRPFDGMGWFVDSPGVLVLPDGSPTDERDPSGYTSQATWMYAMRHGTVTAVVEAPFWSVAAVSDPSPVTRPEQVISRAAEILLGRAKQLEEVLGGLADRPPRDARRLAFHTAARELMDIGPGVVDTWNTHDAHGLGDAELATTVGNSVSLGIAARRIPLRAAAMMRSALDEPSEGVDTLVREWSRELRATFGTRWVPVHRQTALHTRTMMHLARQLLSP
ncbi:M14 family zinc carboxypeptidase [Streptomyces fructofermentans]|uniref:Hydroxylacyl-CoA dehydrogenase n=1 Tax=Streptomyces fructofermentans TaxID=152141 RepID=A0A918K9Y0_9ACTN|nr:M14 family zinc carboxypeptidase [Streptomyces fructofermentans]GGX54676.1 hydroxylacyl-CoA dehydrogenase [Streptomyces fructofermentans]